MDENRPEDRPTPPPEPDPEPQREQQPPPPPPPPPAVSQNRQLMIVLAYLWILALVPLLVDQRDAEVQWHAKNGLLLTAAELVLHILLMFIPFLGCMVGMLIWLASIGIRIAAIMKGLRNERLRIPGVSDFADQWK